MLVQCDIYKETGKWYAGGKVELEKLPYENGVLKNFLEKQKILLSGSFSEPYFYIVMSDIPESHNDPNYRMTYNRLYMPEDIVLAYYKIEEEIKTL